nr:hypothetical protein [Sinorhizobium meliloti]
MIFLGGWGNSASPTNAPVYEDSNAPGFNNADDWYDDTSTDRLPQRFPLRGILYPTQEPGSLPLRRTPPPGLSVGARCMTRCATFMCGPAG